MKILPINDIAWNFHASNSNKLNYNNSSTYNITDLNFLNKSYKQVNFKGLPLKESLKFIQQLPLEDRLASIFQTIQQGD